MNTSLSFPPDHPFEKAPRRNPAEPLLIVLRAGTRLRRAMALQEIVTKAQTLNVHVLDGAGWLTQPEALTPYLRPDLTPAGQVQIAYPGHSEQLVQMLEAAPGEAELLFVLEPVGLILGHAHPEAQLHRLLAEMQRLKTEIKLAMTLPHTLKTRPALNPWLQILEDQAETVVREEVPFLTLPGGRSPADAD